jgi:hypothetical protein
MADNIAIDTVVDEVSGFGAQFDTSGLTANRTIRVPDANNTTVVPINTPAGQIFTGLNNSGVITTGYLDVSTETQFTANTNNFTPSSGAYYLRLSTDASRDLTGLTGGGVAAAPVAGETHRIINVGSFDLVLKHESASSTALNRFHSVTGSDVTLTAGQEGDLHYDATALRWRLLPTGSSGGGGGTPGGSNTQFQYDNAGSFGGVPLTLYTGSAVLQQAGTSYALTDPSDATKKANFDLSNNTTAQTRTIRVPDANCCAVVPDTGATNNVLTGISAAGVISKAQLGFSSLSGTATNAQLPTTISGKSFTDTNTLAIKDAGNFVLENASDTTKTATFALSNITTGTNRIINIPDANSCTVQPNAGTSHQWLASVSSQGVFTSSQPTFADITSSTSQAIGVGSIELGNASDTTIARSGAGAITVEGVQVILSGAALGTPASGTLTNCTFPTLNQNTTGSAAKWTTARTLALTGDVTYTSPSLDGTGNVTAAAAVANVPTAATFASDLTAVPLNLGGWVEYFVTGTDFTTTNLTATAITGMTSGTLTNAAWYEFQIVLRCLNAADSAGMKFAITGVGTGTASQVFCTFLVNSGTNATAIGASLNAIATLSGAFVTYSSGEGILTAQGFFLSRSTGTATMEVDIAKVTSNTATVRVGSVLRIRKAHV